MNLFQRIKPLLLSTLLYVSLFSGYSESRAEPKIEFTAQESKNYQIEGYEMHLERNSKIISKNGQIRIGVHINYEIKPPKKINPKSPELEFLIATFKGKPLILPNKEKFLGNILYYDKEGFFIKEKARIWELEISNKDMRKIYFDFNGELNENAQHSYISINKKRIIISSKKEPLELIFNKNNPYLKIDDGDYASIIIEKGYISIENEYSREIIPKAFSKSEILKIKNGSMILEKNKESLTLKKIKTNSEPFSTSTPLELIINSQDTSELSLNKKRIKDHKLIFDNFNRLGIIPKNKEESFYSNKGIEILFSEKLSNNYPTEEEIENLIGSNNLHFNEYNSQISRGHKDFFLGIFRDSWNTLTPETKRYLSRYQITIVNEIIEERFKSNSAAAYTSENRWCKFNISEFNFKIFKHESAHIQDFQQNSYMNEEWKNITKPEEYINNENKLSTEWQEDKFLTKTKKNKLKASYGKDWDERPKDGFASPYGKNNKYEDIATFVERIVIEPEIFNDFLKKNNPNYDSRYLEKVKLLHKHKFISDKEYNRVQKLSETKNEKRNP